MRKLITWKRMGGPLDPENNNEITNYLSHSSFLNHLSSNDVQTIRRNKIFASIRNDAPHIVFDFRYESLHTRDHLFASLSKQFNEVISVNKNACEPFQVNFCNYNSDGHFHKKYGQNLGIDENLIFETKSSYTDIFPSEKMVYLSRDAKKPMEKFDPNKVYIIGSLTGMNHNEVHRFASFNQATRDCIECQRLPLEKCVK